MNKMTKRVCRFGALVLLSLAVATPSFEATVPSAGSQLQVIVSCRGPKGVQGVAAVVVNGITDEGVQIALRGEKIPCSDAARTNTTTTDYMGIQLLNWNAQLVALNSQGSMTCDEAGESFPVQVACSIPADPNNPNSPLFTVQLRIQD